MLEITEINDEDSLEEWLKGQPCEVLIWIARRAAMRVLPIYWQWVYESSVAKKNKLTTLPVLRFNLVSEVMRTMPALDIFIIEAATDAASSNVAGAFNLINNESNASFATNDHAAGTAAGAAFYAATAAHHSVNVARSVQGLPGFADRANSAIRDANRAVREAKRSSEDVADAATWNAIRWDCEAINGADKDEISALALERLPLWHDEDNPLQPEWKALKHTLTKPSQPLDWGLWIKWYDSVLKGESLNKDMLIEIAQIKGDVWEQGEVVALKSINEICLRYEVADHAQEAARLLAKERQAPVGIGHNRPPDEIEKTLLTEEDLECISDVINELKDADSIKGQGKEETEDQISKLRVWWEKASEFAKGIAQDVKSRVSKDAGGAIYIGLIIAVEKLLEALVNWLPFL